MAFWTKIARRAFLKKPLNNNRFNIFRQYLFRSLLGIKCWVSIISASKKRIENCRYRSKFDRPHPAIKSSHLYRPVHTHSRIICRPPNRVHAVTNRAVLASRAKVGAVMPIKWLSPKSKCTFYRIFTSPAIFSQRQHYLQAKMPSPSKALKPNASNSHEKCQNTTPAKPDIDLMNPQPAYTSLILNNCSAYYTAYATTATASSWLNLI